MISPEIRYCLRAGGKLERLGIRGDRTVGISERLEEARRKLARAGRRHPDGVVLVSADGLINLIDAGACRLLQVDPRRVLGKSLAELDLESEGQPESATVELESGGAVGLYGSEEIFEEECVSSSFEWMGDVESLVELMSRFGDWAEGVSDGQPGAVAIREGEMMVLWSYWPVDDAPLMPLRFRAMESRAYRTGVASLGWDWEEVRRDDAMVFPVVLNGSVMALVAVAGDQPEVEESLRALGSALRRFV